MIAIIVLAGVLPLILSLAALEITGYRHLISTRGAVYEREATHVALTLHRILERDIRNLTSLITVGQVPELIRQIESTSPPPAGADVPALDARWPAL
ncbi:MAG TPA: hypothetical protein VIS74_03660, partial [Chthoniobacterales bacterium]